MSRLLFMSPMVPSTDVSATAQFLHDALGFEVKRYGTYAICERDGLTLHLQPAGEGIGEQSIYLEVDELESVWQTLAPHLDGIRHRPPHDREYGMREVHFDLPDTQTLVFLGQCL